MVAMGMAGFVATDVRVEDRSVVGFVRGEGILSDTTVTEGIVMPRVTPVVEMDTNGIYASK